MNPASEPPAAVILIYHRVTEVPSDPLLLCVSPGRFAEQLDVLREQCRPVSLRGLADAVRSGSVPERGVVITFDDGYADNLLHARPLLEQREMPATVFVTTGEPDRPRELWWDELEALLLGPGTFADPLRLVLDGRPCEWALGEAAAYGPDAFERNRRWTVLDRQAPTVRQELYRTLHDRLRRLSPAKRWEILDALRRQLDAAPAPTIRPTHRQLSPDEIRTLADGGLVEIGAHTVRHPVLSALSVTEQQAEITNARARLEAILGRPVSSFSYPYGCRSDYTAETVQLVRDAGFACACANHAGLVRADTDPYRFPRILVRDWNGDEFARQLEQAWNHHRTRSAGEGPECTRRADRNPPPLQGRRTR